MVDLIAVDPTFRGMGFGQALLGRAKKKGQRILAGTQEADRASCRLYESSSFLLEKWKGLYSAPIKTLPTKNEGASAVRDGANAGMKTGPVH